MQVKHTKTKTLLEAFLPIFHYILPLQQNFCSFFIFFVFLKAVLPLIIFGVLSSHSSPVYPCLTLCYDSTRLINEIKSKGQREREWPHFRQDPERSRILVGMFLRGEDEQQRSSSSSWSAAGWREGQRWEMMDGTEWQDNKQASQLLILHVCAQV